MCMLFPWSRISPNMEGLLTEMRIAMYMCILFPWPPISPTWRVLQREMRIAMSVCVYYSLDHIFPKHGGGCSQKWELQCLYVYIIPLITYFPIMEGVLREMGIAMSVCVYYYVDHLFPQHRVGCSLKWELHCLYMYIIPLVTYFPKHGGGCSEKWELQCLYVYIIPLITYFPKHVGVAHIKENCNAYVYVIPLVTYFPKHGGVAHRNENCNVYVYIIPLTTYFPNMESVAERNENCNVCVCILFPWSPISTTWRGLLTEMRIALSVYVYYSFDHLFPQHGRGFSQKWELQCLHVYIIPLITYFPTMEGVAHINENCNVSMCILFPWSPISPTWRGLLTEMRIAMSVYVYYSFDHLFFHHGGGCWENWELQCMYLYIIPLITYFPNMEGVARRNENCNVCMCILLPWSPISPNM